MVLHVAPNMPTTPILPSNFKGIKLISYGVRYGYVNADINIDVRSFMNPDLVHWSESGFDDDVYRRYLKEYDHFIHAIRRLIFAAYAAQKDAFVVGISCTNGRHRSVVVVRYLENELKRSQIPVIVEHRDSVND